jgi:hypothetical protein
MAHLAPGRPGQTAHPGNNLMALDVPLNMPVEGFFPGREPLSRTGCSWGTPAPEQRSLPPDRR